MSDNQENLAPVKVLFVDDESNILRSLKRLMVEEDFEVVTAESGEEGLEVVKLEVNLGLIVSDQRMPGMGGAEFLAKAKEIKPDTVRIILTGYADLNATMDAINLGGAYRYITKPWDDDEIVQVVRDAVARYRLVAENKRLNELVNQKNEELKEWNANLKRRVLDRTADLRKKSEELARANRHLVVDFENSIRAFSGLIELRDKDVRDHSKNVADLSIKVAEQQGLEEQMVQTVKSAALLHDIGKIGIGDTVLFKDGFALTPKEHEEYESHSVRGQAAIDTIEDLREVGVLIRHHHENYDGTGFPDKIGGEEIPLGSRIIAIADFIDRTVKRVRDDNVLELALHRVYENLGKEFDPALYAAFKELAESVYTPGMDFTKRRGMIECEVEPHDLREGMIVMRDVQSGTGLLLISKNYTLDEKALKGLKRYCRIDPPEEQVLVLKQL